jgi:hypothetical protein
MIIDDRAAFRWSIGCSDASLGPGASSTATASIIATLRIDLELIACEGAKSDAPGAAARLGASFV